MRARFWWALRNWWHYPSFHHGGYRPKYLSWIIISYNLKHKNYRGLYMFIKTDIKHLIWRTYWDLRYLQPFRCNGNKGGWRTKVCDWLEDKARSYEE